jgi:hypothetical protein
MAEYWAPHQDPEGESTELDFIAASTVTLDGLVREVRGKLAARAKAHGPFRAATLPGYFYLRDKPAAGGVGILHSVSVQGAVVDPRDYRPALEQVAHYEIFEIPDGLSGSMSLQLQQRYGFDRGGGHLFFGGGDAVPIPPRVPLSGELVGRQISEADRWIEAEQAERRLGLDYLSEAGAQRLATYIAAAAPIE